MVFFIKVGCYCCYKGVVLSSNEFYVFGVCDLWEFGVFVIGFNDIWNFGWGGFIGFEEDFYKFKVF